MFTATMVKGLEEAKRREIPQAERATFVREYCRENASGMKAMLSAMSEGLSHPKGSR